MKNSISPQKKEHSIRYALAVTPNIQFFRKPPAKSG